MKTTGEVAVVSVGVEEVPGSTGGSLRHERNVAMITPKMNRMDFFPIMGW